MSAETDTMRQIKADEAGQESARESVDVGEELIG